MRGKPADMEPVSVGDDDGEEAPYEQVYRSGTVAVCDEDAEFNIGHVAIEVVSHQQSHFAPQWGQWCLRWACDSWP